MGVSMFMTKEMREDPIAQFALALLEAQWTVADRFFRAASWLLGLGALKAVQVATNDTNVEFAFVALLAIWTVTVVAQLYQALLIGFAPVVERIMLPDGEVSARNLARFVIVVGLLAMIVTFGAYVIWPIIDSTSQAIVNFAGKR